MIIMVKNIISVIIGCNKNLVMGVFSVLVICIDILFISILNYMDPCRTYKNIRTALV